MKRVLAMIGVTAAALGADAAVSSRSYVQRGLVAQYDGINNVGHNAEHSTSTKVWKDLTGNGNDGNCASLLSWSADGWSVSGDCKPVTVPAPGLAATTGTREFTIQFACTPAMDNKREAFFSQYNYTTAYGGFGLEHNNGGNFTGKLRYYKFTSRTGNDYLDELTSAKIAANTFTSASVAISPSVQKCWLNGVLSDTRNATVSMVSRSCPSVIGGEPQGGGRTGSAYTDGYGIAFQGKYNAFRLYDRPLSEDEAKVNAAVDAIRFNGADPGSFALTGGWSFDAAGDLCVDVTVAASGNGTVSVNGGASPVTVKQFATVALTATPAAGSVFYRWEGDTHAIVSGSALTPSIEVSAADPVSMVAVFKAPTQGLSAYSYIRRGLVANFDGIDNAGTGAHNSSASTWTDLTGNGNDATKGSNASWNGADGWTSSTDGKPMVVPEGNGAETTIAGATVDKVFSVQFAVKPSRHTARQCFFGQWDKNGVSIEHNAGGYSSGCMRAYYNYLPGNIGAADDMFTQILVTSDEWATMSVLSDTARQTVWKNGQTSQTIVKALTGTLTNRCPTVIGGDNARATMGFCGTYNALRLYNRVLSEEEVKVNAAIDDRRFNGGAKGLALPAGWSLTDGTLMVDVSVTTTDGGRVSYRGGAAAKSVTDAVNHDGSKVLVFAAVPDAGYVFERWSGSTDLIVSGSTITGEITVDPDRPVTLVAKFRRNGDTADGKVFDLSFTGDATADGMTFSDTVAEDKHGYVTANIALPVLPTVTNANVSCLYLPQPLNSDKTGTYWQMAVSDKPAVTGDVATVFVRFRWDGPVISSLANYSAMFHNGYNGWTSIGQGFLIRLCSLAKSTDAYLSLLVGGREATGESNAIEDVSGVGFIKPGEWVDVFVSVYPSPTDSTLSNADIWYCRPPSWNSGGWFNVSTIGHRHIGDAAKIPHMDSTTTLLRAGCESAPSASVAVTGNNATKVFRGAIAAAKGWNRLLSESEMWTVMAGFDGVPSFGEGRVFKTNTLTTQEGHNGTATAFVGDQAVEHFWRALHKAYPSLTLVWNAPKDKPAQSVFYDTVVANTRSGNTHPVHLEVNGTKVWSSDNLSKGDTICIWIDSAYTLPGINELKWVYDTDVADNWMTFEYHKLRIGETGVSIILK